MTVHAHAGERRRRSLAEQIDGLPVLDARPEGSGRDPAFLTAPVTAIELAFQSFHARRPEIYRALELEALARVTRGERRLAIARLVEELRYDARFTRDAERDAFRINNNFRALYVRLLIHYHPSLREVFALRDRHETSDDD